MHYLVDNNVSFTANFSSGAQTAAEMFRTVSKIDFRFNSKPYWNLLVLLIQLFTSKILTLIFINCCQTILNGSSCLDYYWKPNASTFLRFLRLCACVKVFLISVEFIFINFNMWCCTALYFTNLIVQQLQVVFQRV